MKFKRAAFILALVLGGGLSAPVMAESARGHLNKMAIRALPVMPWLVLGVTKPQAVSQRLSQQNMPVIEGTFAHTGGPLINTMSIGNDVFPGEVGLRIVSMGFEKDQRLASVTFMVDRGFKDVNLQPLIQRISQRYAGYAAPVRVGDDRGDNGDWYVLFDLGRYTVEIAVPEQSKRARVVFATREIYEQMRQADSTADLLLPHLAPM